MTYIIISDLSITINSDGLQLAASLRPGFCCSVQFLYCDDLIFIPELHQCGG